MTTLLPDKRILAISPCTMNRIAVISVTFVVLSCARQTRQGAADPDGPVLSNNQAVSGEIRAKDGIRYADVVIGTGAVAVAGKCVYAHYTGWLEGRGDAGKFDSSRDPQPNGSPGTPIGFILGTRRVIAGWDIGFEGMKVGGKRRLFIPPELGYGARGAGGVIPPNAALVFDVELLGMSEPRSDRSCPPWR